MTEQTFSTDLGNIAQQGGNTAPVDAVAEPVVTKDQDGKPASTDEGSGQDDTPAWMKREITKERNKRRAIEDELTQAREHAANLAKALAERKQPETPAERPKRPRADQFFQPEDYDAAMDEYDDAMSAWNVNKAKAEIAAETSAARAEQASTVRATAMQTAWQQQLTAAKAKLPDVEDVLQDPDFAKAVEALKPGNAEAIAEAITTDENGVLIMYHLASNPDEASRIFALPSAAAQVREIGKLAVKVAQPAPVSKAPAPIKPVRGQSPAGNKDPEHETQDEYSARRRSEMQARGEKAY